TLRLARNPHAFADACENAGFSTPPLHASASANSNAKNILRKPIHSAGGRSISLADSDTPCSSGVYYQQRIDGQPISAIYVATGRHAQILGITFQLIGDDGSGNFWCTSTWTGAQGYWYSGTIGPIAAPDSLT